MVVRFLSCVPESHVFEHAENNDQPETMQSSVNCAPVHKR